MRQHQNNNPGALLVGITGGVAAGKSTALEILEQLGQQTLDTDRVVHQIYQTERAVVDALQARYGPAVVDDRQGIDRRKLADIAFGSRPEIEWLNQLIHPVVKQKVVKTKAELQGILFCAVPLLFEVGWDADTDCTIAVWCDADTQKERIQARGWSTDELTRRQSIQLSMDEKLARANYALINNSTIEVLREQLTRLVDQINTAFQS